MRTYHLCNAEDTLVCITPCAFYAIETLLRDKKSRVHTIDYQRPAREPGPLLPDSAPAAT